MEEERGERVMVADQRDEEAKDGARDSSTIKRHW